MSAQATKCFADMIIDMGQTTIERSGDELALLDAAAWLIWDIINCRKVPPSVRKAIMSYKTARDRRVNLAVKEATVKMASGAGYPKTLDSNRESAYDVASRLHGSTPKTIKNQLSKRRSPRKAHDTR